MLRVSLQQPSHLRPPVCPLSVAHAQAPHLRLAVPTGLYDCSCKIGLLPHMEAIAAATAAAMAIQRPNRSSSSDGGTTSPAKNHSCLDAETTLAAAWRPLASLPLMHTNPTNAIRNQFPQIRSHGRWSFFFRTHTSGALKREK